jgi:hypothetical protein
VDPPDQEYEKAPELSSTIARRSIDMMEEDKAYNSQRVVCGLPNDFAEITPRSGTPKLHGQT